MKNRFALEKLIQKKKKMLLLTLHSFKWDKIQFYPLNLNFKMILRLTIHKMLTII